MHMGVGCRDGLIQFGYAEVAGLRVCAVGLRNCSLPSGVRMCEDVEHHVDQNPAQRVPIVVFEANCLAAAVMHDAVAQSIQSLPGGGRGIGANVAVEESTEILEIGSVSMLEHQVQT